MEHLERLIQELQEPASYPHDAADIVVHQTHISLVFLAGDFAYKIKKPVDFGFVDYSTLDDRRHFCEREVELNRRLAPNVYLGVVPVMEREGRLVLAGDDESDPGAVVEWAVKMRRLEDADTLRDRLAADRLPADLMPRLGRFLAGFHAGAGRGPEIAKRGRYRQVAKNALDNFEQTRTHVGSVVAREVHERAESLTRDCLEEQADLIRWRAESGRTADCHGDLRLEHVYVSDDGDITVVDCVEFNDAFRYADPVSDVAFLVMDLVIRGYGREAAQVVDAWFESVGDAEGRGLLDLYTAYRSCVRAKVHGLKAVGDSVPEEERESARRRARMHWGFGLTVLSPARERPRLVMVGGLPGTGKSTVARSLMEHGWLDEVVRSDVVRKELAGLGAGQSASDEYGSGIYTKEWTRRTYDACRDRASAALKRGRRVAIDASFHDDGERRACVRLARELGVQPVFLECRLPAERASERMSGRRGDASDADEAVHRRMKHDWQAASGEVARVRVALDTDGDINAVAERAVGLLRDMPLLPEAGG